jgi:hypothetical protein
MGRFDVLKQTRMTDSEIPTDTLAVEAPDPVPAKAASNAKRGNPDYRQFSAYIRADLYRRLKVRLAESDTDLSDAINEAVDLWLRKQS